MLQVLQVFGFLGPQSLLASLIFQVLEGERSKMAAGAAEESRVMGPQMKHSRRDPFPDWAQRFANSWHKNLQKTLKKKEKQKKRTWNKTPRSHDAPMSKARAR
jgi:hypothetical protein